VAGATLALIRLANAAAQLPYGSGKTKGEASPPSQHQSRPYAVGSMTAKPSISTSVSFWKKPDTSNKAIAG